MEIIFTNVEKQTGKFFSVVVVCHSLPLDSNEKAIKIIQVRIEFAKIGRFGDCHVVEKCI